ncbi:hypothetical protein K432DRAFT_408020 [Lepidopterella palustris CBS 459.81]|uniref:Calcium channel YVC1-like C-terminal transmembrane domain-containing protein n=1 Tax=Lepidopterella palustris CBS 459.81 TaxID=1314670 RepID=A0A8E2E3M6_9PEZI|nr:hypothetical protein K432DRAFT_408020 [Lepidopterella palustris CBS 459.81]
MASQPTTPMWAETSPELPVIGDDEPFAELVRKLSFYFTDAIEAPHTFDELRTMPTGRSLAPLIRYLSDSVHHPAIVSALLALKTHFAALETDDDRGVNDARGYACEIVAWRFVTHLSEREAIDFLLYELPSVPTATAQSHDPESGVTSQSNGHPLVDPAHEETPLLPTTPTSERPRYSRTVSQFGTDTVFASAADAAHADDFTCQFVNLSALEIAVVSGSKKFLSQRAVQKIINGIWRGDIVFWETLSVNSVKKAKLYNRRRADPFCRLRVPRYLKTFETIYFAMFLVLYYAVLVQRSFSHVTVAEIFLYIWIAGFAYDEFGEIQDAGQTSFYITDFWFLWDLGIVAVGTGFFVLRIVGLNMHSDNVIDMSFDILALEALLLIPRICSLLSLNPYFGTLIPCLKEMTKDFCKFLSLVIILYLGFLTTFTLLARDQFTLNEMSWILIKVFFGSSYLGFDVAQEISRLFGPPVMLIFVALTNILLITSLISLLSNSLTKVLDHARDEYLYIYSVYVLEASTSNRLTYYLPPLNLIPLFFRPLRLVLPSEKLRSARIVLLKITHAPFVAAIWVFEHGHDYLTGRSSTSRRTRWQESWVSSMGGPETSPSVKRPPLKSSLNSPRPLAPATGVQASLDGNFGGRSPFGHRPRSTMGLPESDAQVRSLVIKLSSQVEQLTAMVAQLQGQQGAGMAEAE